MSNTDQRRTPWRIVRKVEQQRETYLTHTPDTDPAQAAEQFERRTGAQPEKQFTEYGLLWSGPVSEE